MENVGLQNVSGKSVRKMKAYTVYQPYAFATVVGLKHYETRTRRTHIRGRVAVHAGKKKIKGKEADRLYMDVLLTGKENELAWHICRKSHPEEFGVVVGTVEIVDCVPVEDVADSLTPQEKALGGLLAGALGLGPEKSGHVRYTDSRPWAARLVELGGVTEEWKRDIAGGRSGPTRKDARWTIPNEEMKDCTGCAWHKETEGQE